jgi:hypothetical protein
LSPPIITVRCGFNSASPAYVHDHLLRERSREVADLIDDARQAGEHDVAIMISLLDSATHRWCVWLYGQPLHKQGDDPDQAVVDICGIHEFSMRGKDRECANACVDALRSILFQDYTKTTVDLGTLLHSLAGEQHAVQMLVDVLVYGPCARSGKTREWLAGTRAEEKWVHFFHQLNLTFAMRVADEAAGNEDLPPDIMRKHAYHIADGASGECCGVAADIVGDVSFPTALTYHCMH